MGICRDFSILFQLFTAGFRFFIFLFIATNLNAQSGFAVVGEPDQCKADFPGQYLDCGFRPLAAIRGHEILPAVIDQCAQQAFGPKARAATTKLLLQREAIMRQLTVTAPPETEGIPAAYLLPINDAPANLHDATLLGINGALCLLHRDGSEIKIASAINTRLAGPFGVLPIWFIWQSDRNKRYAHLALARPDNSGRGFREEEMLLIQLDRRRGQLAILDRVSDDGEFRPRASGGGSFSFHFSADNHEYSVCVRGIPPEDFGPLSSAELEEAHIKKRCGIRPQEGKSYRVGHRKFRRILAH